MTCRAFALNVRDVMTTFLAALTVQTLLQARTQIRLLKRHRLSRLAPAPQNLRCMRSKYTVASLMKIATYFPAAVNLSDFLEMLHDNKPLLV